MSLVWYLCSIVVDTDIKVGACGVFLQTELATWQCYHHHYCPSPQGMSWPLTTDTYKANTKTSKQYPVSRSMSMSVMSSYDRSA
jgi:hypothetical protein